MTSANEDSNKYAELSEWCISEAEGYLQRGNNIQASEKVWGATAQALKAIAEERGWNHGSHTLIVDVAEQVTHEENRPDLIRLFSTAQSLHTNFYEDWLSPDTVSVYLEDVKNCCLSWNASEGSRPRNLLPRLATSATGGGG